MFRTFASASAGAGGGSITAPSAGTGAAGGWHPTVVYMGLLIAAEIIAVAFLSRHLLS